jgi:hypothetical protein
MFIYVCVFVCICNVCTTRRGLVGIKFNQTKANVQRSSFTGSYTHTYEHRTHLRYLKIYYTRIYNCPKTKEINLKQIPTRLHHSLSPNLYSLPESLKNIWVIIYVDSMKRITRTGSERHGLTDKDKRQPSEVKCTSKEDNKEKDKYEVFVDSAACVACLGDSTRGAPNHVSTR